MISPDTSEGAFRPCRVNGVLSNAVLDTGAEATIINEDIQYYINTIQVRLIPHTKACC